MSQLFGSAATDAAGKNEHLKKVFWPRTGAGSSWIAPNSKELS